MRSIKISKIREIPKRNKIMKKNIQKLKYMKTRRIEVIKPILEDKTANEKNFGCSREVGVLSSLRLA